MGKENGTYVRIAGTTRLADEAMIRELTFEGNNRAIFVNKRELSGPIYEQNLKEYIVKMIMKYHRKVLGS